MRHAFRNPFRIPFHQFKVLRLVWWNLSVVVSLPKRQMVEIGIKKVKLDIFPFYVTVFISDDLGAKLVFFVHSYTVFYYRQPPIISLNTNLANLTN